MKEKQCNIIDCILIVLIIVFTMHSVFKEEQEYEQGTLDCTGNDCGSMALPKPRY